MSVYLTRNGRFVGVEPAKPSVVYADRRAGGSWEAAIVTPHGSGLVDVRFGAANVQLCITPDGVLASRPAGAIGEWELLTLSADATTISRANVSLTVDGVIAPPGPPIAPLHLEQRDNDFVDAGGHRIVFPATDQFFAFRQYRDGGPDALTPAIEESKRLGFTCWRMWSQGSKRQNTIADLNPNEAGYYDDVRPCTDLLNRHGIVPLWTGYVDDQDVQSGPGHWPALGERLVGSAALLSVANQWQKNMRGFDPWALGSPGAGLIWSRGSSVNLDEQTPPRGAPASELHPTQNSFERALMDATASPINMRATNGSGLVWMTEGHPFGDGAAYSEQQAWQLGRGYSIDWGLIVFHNRQGQRMELLHDDTARCAAAWVKGMRL